MKFSTTQDTELSSEQLFDALADFDRIERLLTRRGALVRRVDPAREPGAGMAWEIGFDWRARRREVRLDVTRFDRPEVIEVEGRSELFDIELKLTVIALTLCKARLQFEVKLRPRNMRARLLLQTAKLGKVQLDRKFALRIAEFVDDITRAAVA